MSRRLSLRASTGVSLAIAIWLAAISAAPAQDQTPTFRAAADAVQVEVSVRDGRGRPIAGLAPADFRVTDNGVQQRVTDASYGQLPIDITVLLDVSRSVTGPVLDQLRRATMQLMRDLGDDDRLRLVTFNMRVSRVLNFTTDTAAVERAIQAASAAGGSSIRDAVSLALVSASAPDRRQLLVLFTDGADSSSVTSRAALVEVAQRTNAAVTSVVSPRLRSAGASPPERRNLRALEALADETGGTVLAAAGNLTPAFRQALEEFRSSYVLYYTPAGVERTGFHRLDVSVPRGGDYVVRARRSYFGR